MSFPHKKFLKKWLTVISGGNPRLKRWLSVISDGNPGLKLWLAITSDSNPLFKRKENTSPKRRLFLIKGAVHPSIELLYIHAPSIWCTLQCIISWKRREIFFLSPNTFSFMIFHESICAKLGGTMRILEIKGNAFRISISQSRPKTLYQKIFLCLQLMSRHKLFSIGVKSQLV